MPGVVGVTWRRSGGSSGRADTGSTPKRWPRPSSNTSRPGGITEVRAVVQRVTRAAVRVDGDTVGSIESGFLVLLGIGVGDDAADAAAMASKIGGLRVFADADGRMNLSLVDVGGGVLVVSQFTLLAETRKGRRPSFVAAASPEVADPLVEAVAERLRDQGIGVETGRFGARMEVESVNEGPVTIVIDVVDGSVQ
jgi:D-tyrosyl-tRNA(Tyr) deacylase